MGGARMTRERGRSASRAVAPGLELIATTALIERPVDAWLALGPGDRILVTTNVDGMVNVIDMKTRLVIQKLPVAKAHGIASVGIAAP